MDLETGSAAADPEDLDLAGKRDMARHCSEHENVHLVGRQLETEDEVPEHMELEMRVHLGMVQESYDQLVSRGVGLVRMEPESCGRYLASSNEELDHAFEGCHHWDRDHEDLGRDELAVGLMGERRLENHLDLDEA
jgi:hypothetical protein